MSSALFSHPQGAHSSLESKHHPPSAAATHRLNPSLASTVAQMQHPQTALIHLPFAHHYLIRLSLTTNTHHSISVLMGGASTAGKSKVLAPFHSAVQGMINAEEGVNDDIGALSSPIPSSSSSQAESTSVRLGHSYYMLEACTNSGLSSLMKYKQQVNP